MKTKIVLIHFVLASAAFAFAPLARAYESDESDTSGQIRVDVVVDMTEAGHKIARPTSDQPAYYLPLSVGYKEFGYAHHFQRPPPNEWDIEHALAKVLYDQGYQLMTKRGHPSLVLVFWWGYMAPEEEDVNYNTFLTTKAGAFQAPAGDQGAAGGLWGPGATGVGAIPSGNFLGGAYGYADLGGPKNTYSPPGGESLTHDPPTTGFAAFPEFAFGNVNANEDKMLSLVAGNTIDDHQKFPDPRIDDVVQLVNQPRYFVLVSAFEFQSWLHHKPVLMWRAHVSTELWGHYFDEVVGTLINTAAPYFGRETKVPQFIGAPTTPLGRVIVGTPEVTNYPATAPTP